MCTSRLSLHLAVHANAEVLRDESERYSGVGSALQAQAHALLCGLRLESGFKMPVHALARKVSLPVCAALYHNVRFMAFQCSTPWHFQLPFRYTGFSGMLLTCVARRAQAAALAGGGCGGAPAAERRAACAPEPGRGHARACIPGGRRGHGPRAGQPAAGGCGRRIGRRDWGVRV